MVGYLTFYFFQILITIQSVGTKHAADRQRLVPSVGDWSIRDIHEPGGD